jgi:hypothetical protein
VGILLSLDGAESHRNGRKSNHVITGRIFVPFLPVHHSTNLHLHLLQYQLVCSTRVNVSRATDYTGEVALKVDVDFLGLLFTLSIKGSALQ